MIFKSRFILLIAVLFAAFLGLVSLFSVFTDGSDFADETLAINRLLFTPDDGEPYIIEDFSSTSPRFDGYYTISYNLSASEETCSLSFSFGIGSATLSIDENTIYSGHSYSCDNLLGTPTEEAMLDASPKDRTVTAVVRYTDPDSYIFPALLLAEKPDRQFMRMAAVINSSAIFAGMSGAAFLIVIVLFLLSISFSNPDYSLLFLGLGILFYCVGKLFDTNAVPCPDSLAFFVYSVIPYLVAPCVLLYLILNRQKGLLKVFWIFSGCLAVLIIAASLLRLVCDHVPTGVMKMQLLASLLYAGRFNAVLSIATQYMILITVAAALVYHIGKIIRTQSEKTALKSRTEAMVSGYESLVNNVEKTAALRHEWKNDLIALSLLYQQGKTSELGEYLDDKTRFLSETDKVPFTENFVFDVILSSYAAKAQTEGVDFDTTVHIPRDLPIKEEDLCSLLMNMLDNALNACRQVTDRQSFIRFTAEKKEPFLPSAVQTAPPSLLKRNKPAIFHMGGA